MPPTQTQPPVPPKIPTGQEVFDAIMGHIEPELTSEGTKMLDERYKNETPEELDTRKKRYVLAYERYEQAYEGYIETLHAQVMRYRHESIVQVEVEDRMEDAKAIDVLSKGFLQFT